MKILFLSRTDLFKKRGGDTLQMEKTREALERLYSDIKVDISTEIKPGNISDYDIVHLFNIDWIPETYPNFIWAKEHNKPVVLSAIHHSEEEVKRYEREYRFDIRRLFNLLVPSQSIRDELKNIYRSIFTDRNKLNPTIEQIIKGIRNQQKEIVENSDRVLVQTDAEAVDIKKDFSTGDFKWVKVVNGVDLDIFKNAKPDIFKKYLYDEGVKPSSILLMVGGIEPRKNQLSVIKAFNKVQSLKSEFKEWKIVLIGEENKNHPEYLFRIRKQYKDVLYCGKRPQEFIASAMAHSGIFVYGSWFETTGLAALEAATCGMVPIITGNRTKEYLGKNAVYCDPGDIESIKNAILEASMRQRIGREIINELEEKYTWINTANETFEVYKELMK